MAGRTWSECACWRRGISYISFVLVILPLISSHPQCLDFRPPFQVDLGLDFCSQYSDFGCCTRERDAEIEEELRHIRSQIGSLAPCEDLLKEVLCQKCSPFAAHLYGAETSYIRRPLPGLCRDFCGDLYRKCAPFLPVLTDDATVWQALETERQFCEHVALSDEDSCYPMLLTNPLLIHEVVSSQTREDGCLCVEEVANDLRNPLLLRAPPDDSGRLMIGEQVGVVYVLYKNGTRLEEPFLDLSSQVLSSSWRGDERGFLGMTFHPEYADNGRLFVYYSIRKNGDQMVRVSELQVSDTDPQRAETSSERILLEISQPQWNHNGGEVSHRKLFYHYSNFTRISCQLSNWLFAFIGLVNGWVVNRWKAIGWTNNDLG